MIRPSSITLVLLAAILGTASVGCGRPPRPSLLAEADRASRSPASADASTQVPQAFARADQLRRESQAAYERNEIAASSILAERALVAYERAAVLARIAKAAVVGETAKQELARWEEELRTLDAEQARLTADVEALEVRVKVLQDAEPIASTGKAEPEREAARRTAAREILVDARLLCAAARMIEPRATGADEADAEVSKAEAAIGTAGRPTAIDDARRARSRCLSLLTSTRRATSQAATVTADQILAELSAKGGLSPVRDDRGVIVAMTPDQVAPRHPKGALEEAAAIAAAHPELPVLVVAWPRDPASAADQSKVRQTGEGVVSSLTSAGVKADRIKLEVAPTAYPSAKPRRGPASERFELVFVVAN